MEEMGSKITSLESALTESREKVAAAPSGQGHNHDDDDTHDNHDDDEKQEEDDIHQVTAALHGRC